MKMLVCVVLLVSAMVAPSYAEALDIKCDRRIESSDPWELDLFKYEFKLNDDDGDDQSELKVKVFLDGNRIREFGARALRSENGEIVHYLIQQLNDSPVSHTRLVFDIDVRDCRESSWGRLMVKRVGHFTDSTDILDWNVPCLCEE